MATDNTPAAATAVPRMPVRHMMAMFVVTNLLLVVLFWLVRIPFMTSEHHAQFPERADPPAPVGDALRHSILVQTTIGSTAIVPLSATAKVITAMQSLSALGSVLLLFVLASVAT